MRLMGFAAVLLCLMTFSARSEEVGSVAHPVPGTWATDTTHTLSSAALEEIARLGTELDDQGAGQLGVAVVSTTGGRNSREYATELFNTWGIGHAGRDDGALLFVALKDHKAEIILGKGVARGEDRARSDALMSREIVPAFKRGAPEQAILAGARGLATLLLQAHVATSTPGPAAAPVAASPDAVRDPPVRMAPLASASPPPPRDEGPPLPWLLGGGVGVAFLGGLGLRAWRRRGVRTCETCGRPREELHPHERVAHLSVGEQAEERLGSAHYLLMRCVPCEGQVVKARNATRFNRHVACSACAFVTALKTEQVIREASYTSEGEKRNTLECSHCGHRAESTFYLPMLVESSSSSDSSSSFDSSSSSDYSSSSSDSSSSSSSDYSGGSSSGDGSSGSW